MEPVLARFAEDECRDDVGVLARFRDGVLGFDLGDVVILVCLGLIPCPELFDGKELSFTGSFRFHDLDFSGATFSNLFLVQP